MAKAAPRPRVPEKAVQQQICTLIRSVGGRVWAIGTTRARGDYPGTRQTPGLPDLIAFVRLPGDLLPAWACVFIECKAEGGRLRPEQIEFRERCLASGMHHLVGGLDDVIAWLCARGVCKADQFPHYRQPKEPV
jgi:hypothetical protein